jgi:hypothetical protein
MATLTFDSYGFVQTLKESGIPEDQAKAIAEGLQKIDLGHVATKEDLRQVQLELKADIQQAKIDLLKWSVPLLIGQVAVFTTIQIGLLAVVLQWSPR